MRIYLKGDLEGEELMDKLKGAGIETTKDDTKTGRTYVDFFGNPLDPTSEIPEVPEELVDFVTHRDVIYVGFRTDGLYEDLGGTLLVRTQKDIHNPMHGGEPKVHQWQELLVRAPSVDELIGLYTLVRTGAIDPVSDYEKGSVEPTES